MPVPSNSFWEQWLTAHRAKPQACVTFSLSPSPLLGEFLGDLDPDLPLDWSSEDYQGALRLREQVLDRYGYRSACCVQDVLITAGAQEANYLALTQLLSPGDEFIIDAPGWQQPLVLARQIGATPKLVPRNEALGWALDVDQLEALVTPKTKLIFICNPNNPTGRVEDEAALRRIIAAADRVGAYVVSDEVYRGLEWTEVETPRVATMYERGVSTGSVSKLLGLQGLRTGWMVTRDRKLIADAMVLRENTSEIMNVMGERIAEVALRPERFAARVERSRATGQARIDLLDRFVAGQPALHWHRPAAGLLGLAHLELPITAESFAQKLLAPPFNTFVMSGTAYACPQHLRLGAGGVSLVELERGLERMAQLLSVCS
ncbi:aminotransferase class I/II-fold pyridoxal phosphate-dependent enzyme [Ralstonia pseudosolanacearum]|uniref:aminotransferase class I/II-fold pyridoxal phosphate-dependent enzyme n=1 Tax=Ralstonia pseudosolanacearum TaxID=1310165 RepID=UPI0002C05FF3|nr:pyridoxal phosphate-dependent aminotransferase [Ralstonia pseudosolanacearum]AKZ28661.1 aminotransferase [Ralstonia solanacearum]ESS49780.1 aminotransferase protein [Ralstonia solanacearum SD54]AGH86532.1 Aspartate aminotransferase [Ralstonia pseudosolanacearum FQY_4]ANH36389.1 Aspartate aminotransferase [Ralstonia solanacearum]MCK4150206.1 pyridoxal phosphate-dependent aminotransferase [Ralstonia pseudosolanacearum]